MQSLLASLRITAATIAVCVVAYGAVILCVAQLLSPETAEGSLIRTADGSVVGSRLIAQSFTSPRYFWPRPSAVDYNGAGAGGSNKSPTSADLKARAEALVARYGASAEKPLPAELAAASGGGLDPHISEHAASYQVERVARARGLEVEAVERMIAEHGFPPGGVLTTERIVNVLELNLALDAIDPTAPGEDR